VSDPVSHGIDSSTYNDMIEEGFLEIIEYSAQHEFDDLTSGIFKHFQKQWILKRGTKCNSRTWKKELYKQ
jgi:hypothetical protein